MPATAGPLQRLGSRVQSQTQPASALSGSIPASLNVPQPQEKTVGIFISAATWRAESACHLITSNHAWRGRSPSRPPVPGALWKPRISPSFEMGMPMLRRFATARRYDARRRRLPTIGPEAQIDLALG